MEAAERSEGKHSSAWREISGEFYENSIWKEQTAMMTIPFWLIKEAISKSSARQSAESCLSRNSRRRERQCCWRERKQEGNSMHLIWWLWILISYFCLTQAVVYIGYWVESPIYSARLYAVRSKTDYFFFSIHSLMSKRHILHKRSTH